MHQVLTDRVVEGLIIEDIESIAQQFEKTFTECIMNVQKPNVLVVGVTGAGKSSLINAIFGSRLANVGDGVPVTQHFTRFAPEDKPVVVYDSKGLEDGYHEAFIAETVSFFNKLQSSPELGSHIHVVWYVVNAAWGRFEPFEERLVREVFARIPVIFVLNKADVASAEQLSGLRHTIESCGFESARGIHVVVADRKNAAQTWCPRCYGDDVTIRRPALTLHCDSCGHDDTLRARHGLEGLVEATARLLPDLAREAFLYSQEASFQEKDRRAKELVKAYSRQLAMDVGGKVLGEVGEMVGRIFLLWGWNLLGTKVSSALVDKMTRDYRAIELSVRLTMVAADTLLKRRMSKSVIACLGVMVNRPLRQLASRLLAMIERNEPLPAANDPSFGLLAAAAEGANAETFPDEFMQAVMERGLEEAIDRYW